MGVDAKAELVIDDTNGVTMTFPDISDIAEIAQGVAVDAPDGTYMVANGEETWTLVVLAGLVASLEAMGVEAVAAVNTELEAETMATLEAIVGEVVASKASIVKLVAELKDLKASLKHEVEVPAGAAAAKEKQPQFKVIG